jgi:HD superfamily phosphohydrolase
MPKTKLFRDPVHGYIVIPVDFCEAFIDTDIFQRLRRIEQTSMRVLYPSAHHDRFSHSLGVFHLGQSAFSNLKNNSNINIDSFENSFLIACLLHDCAHSPFSHTFEKYYLLNREKEIRERLVSNLLEDDSFKKDFESCSPSPHEMISAIVAIEKYKEEIAKFGGNLSLIARMIIGCKFSSSERSFENCLISLLNGLAIDVDKLDYITRDTWASGVSNVKIDYERLLSSLLIREDSDGINKVYFKKNGLNVIKNVIDGRNFLFEWVYSHHKVSYEQYIINQAVKELSKELSSIEDEFCRAFFSIDTLYNKIQYNNFNFFLPCDGDLIYLFKIFYDKIPVIKEFLSRNYRNKALWKTRAEFLHYLKGIDDNGLQKIKILAKEPVQKFLSRKGISGNVIIEDVNIKFLNIAKNQLFIDIDGDEISYTQLFPEIEKNSSNLFFNLFLPNESLVYKTDIIKELRKLK